MRLIKNNKTKLNYFDSAKSLAENNKYDWNKLYANINNLKFWHRSIMRPKYDSYTKAGYIEIPEVLRKYTNGKQWILCYEIHW